MKISTFLRRRPLLFEIVNPLNKFIKLEAFSGILLMIVTVLALFLASSIFSDTYFGFSQQKLTLAFEGFELSKPLMLRINGGLVAIFFFLVGLEIKRETHIGELSTLKTAALPAFLANPHSKEIAKPGILFSSLIAGVVGYPVLFYSGSPKKSKNQIQTKD